MPPSWAVSIRAAKSANVSVPEYTSSIESSTPKLSLMRSRSKDSQKRVAAQVKEVIRHRDGGPLQEIGPNQGQLSFRLRHRLRGLRLNMRGFLEAWRISVALAKVIGDMRIVHGSPDRFLRLLYALRAGRGPVWGDPAQRCQQRCRR